MFFDIILLTNLKQTIKNLIIKDYFLLNVLHNHIYNFYVQLLIFIILPVFYFLQKSVIMQFKQNVEMVGVDKIKENLRFCVIYLLNNVRRVSRFLIKVRLNLNKHIETITKIYKSSI
jgi:NADH:ubiquinone oxidoreductase subunit C